MRRHFHFTDYENVVVTHALSDKCAIFRNQLKKFQFQSVPAIDSLFFVPNIRTYLIVEVCKTTRFGEYSLVRLSD